MTFSQDELIALLSNNSYQIGDINSPLPLLYVEDIKPIHGQLNQEITLDVRGYGFTPDMEIAIPGINVIEFRVINFFHCKVTIQIDYGQFDVSFYLDNNEVEKYSNTVLVINPSFTVDWIDYRTTVPALVESSYVSNPTTSLSEAKIIQTASGLSSSEANNWVVFPDILLPRSSVFTYESITTFVSNSHLRTGLSYSSVNWSDPLRSSFLNGNEARTVGRFYQSNGSSSYTRSDIITGFSWGTPIIHSIFAVDRGKINFKAFGRLGLDYNWNNASSGELIFEKSLTVDNSLDIFTPIVWFRFGLDGVSYLVAQRVS